MKKTALRPNFVNGKGVKCKQCNKTLATNAYLARHIKTRHPKEKLEFICDFDGKKFSNKEYLKIHLERHSNSILTCSVCMKSYLSKHTFRRHLKGVSYLH